MISLEWNEDMCVGIDKIDAEHKKILSITASIIEAIDNNSNAETIEKHFSALALHTATHFKHEEALMETMGFSELIEHQAGHQQFLEQLPKLKHKLLYSGNAGASEQVCQFLFDWVIEHILISDMDYVHAFHSKKDTKKSFFSIFQYASEWLSYRVKLSKRVLIISLLPIIAILLLSFVTIKDNYQQYKNTLLLSNLTKIVYQVNSLTHSLQIERGLFSGYISSDYTRFASALTTRQQKNNDEIRLFSDLLKTQITTFSEPKLRKFIELIQKDMSRLITFRSTIINTDISGEKVLSTYNKIIAQLLSRISRLSHLNMDAQFANNITTISTIVSFKETLGQQRAIGTQLINEDITGHELIHSQLYSNLHILLGMQLNSISVFNYVATPEQQSLCAELCNADMHNAFINKSISDFILQSKAHQSSQYWFNQLTNKMDSIKLVTDQMITNLEYKTAQQLDQLQQKLYSVLLLIITIVIFSTLLFTVLYHSVITPIRRITNALNKVSLGHYNQKMYEYSSRDEIGAMYNAYETLRRKLLQADMSKSIIKRQQQSLLDRRNERDKYRELASRDTLTGALNRRKFNLILKQEIDFAKQDKQKLSLLLLDIDHFKGINDSYGHAGGDQVLRDFYKVCFNSVKSSDVVARIGGEEFAILMPETNSMQAQVIAERLRHNISELEIPYGQDHIRLTVSIGLAQWHESDHLNAEEFIAHIDKALYQAKHDGRNCVKKAG